MNSFPQSIAFLLFVLFFLLGPPPTLRLANQAYGTIERCQANCEASDRLTGPTRMTHTLPHPWKITQFPTKNSGFCKLGCQYFFSQYPNNITCKDACNYAYRYRVTSGYSDVTEESILNCRDGCDIALQTCQAGFYCNGGTMYPCPAGTFRTSATGDEVLQCTECPHGRYRTRDKGKDADECNLCPIGKYANVTGSQTVTECLRCPAGKTAQEEGMRLCVCITPQSCNYRIQRPGETEVQIFYENGVDFARESVPFIGRW